MKRNSYYRLAVIALVVIGGFLVFLCYYFPKQTKEEFLAEYIRHTALLYHQQALQEFRAPQRASEQTADRLVALLKTEDWHRAENHYKMDSLVNILMLRQSSIDDFQLLVSWPNAEKTDTDSLRWPAYYLIRCVWQRKASGIARQCDSLFLNKHLHKATASELLLMPDNEVYTYKKDNYKTIKNLIEQDSLVVMYAYAYSLQLPFEQIVAMPLTDYSLRLYWPQSTNDYEFIAGHFPVAPSDSLIFSQQDTAFALARLVDSKEGYLARLAFCLPDKQAAHLYFVFPQTVLPRMPGLYRQYWLLIALSLLIIFLLYYFTRQFFITATEYKPKAASVLRQNQELEAKVRERTKELETQKKRLLAQSSVLHEINEELERQRIEIHERNEDLNQINEALRISEEKYKILFESFPLGIAITDMDGYILEINREAEVVLGVSKADQIDRRFDDPFWKLRRIDETPMPVHEFPVSQAFYEQKVVRDVETGYLMPDQTIRWLNVSAAPIPLPHYGLAITYSDISERRKAEQALRESEKRYRLLASHLPNTAIYIFDHQFKYLLADGEEIQVNHPGKNKIEGHSLYDVFPQEMIELFEAPYHDALKGNPTTFEHTYNKQQYLQQVLPVRDKIGKIYAGMVVSQNITGIRHTELALSWNRSILTEARRIAKIGTWEWDVLNNKWYTSSEMSAIYGIDKGKMSYELFLKTVYAKDRLAVKQSLTALQQSCRPVNLEYRIVNPKDQRIRYIQAHWEAHCTQDQQLIRLYGTALDISQLKATEYALKTTEKHYHLVLESMNSAILLFDLQGKVLLINRAGTEFLGRPSEDFVGNSLADIFSEELHQKLFDSLATILESGQELRTQDELNLPAGKRWVDMSFRPVYDLDNQMVGVQLVAQDITEKQRAQEEAEKNQRFIQSILDTHPSFLYIYDLQRQRLVYHNDVLTTQLAWPSAFVETSNMQKMIHLIHPHDRAQLQKSEQSVKEAKDNQLISFELRLKHYQTSDWRVYLNNSLVYKRNHQSEVVQIIGTVSDISAVSDAKRSLRKSEERLQMIARHVNEVFWLTENKQVVYVSPGFEGLFGRSSDDFMKNKYLLLDLVFDEDRRKAERAFQSLTRTGILYLEARFQGKNNHAKWVSLQVTSISNFDDPVQKTVGVARDITDQKHAESVVRNTNKMLEKQVWQRTVELQDINEKLKNEIIERQRADRKIQEQYKEIAAVNRELSMANNDLKNNNQALAELNRQLIETSRKLSESEEQYRTLVVNLPGIAVYLFDTNLRLRLVEGTELEQHGLQLQQTEGKLLTEVFELPVLDELSPLVVKALQGQSDSCNLNYGKAWYWLQTVPLKNENQEIYGGLAVFQNITQHIEAQEIIRKSEEKLRAIFDNSLQAFFIIDREGRIQALNRIAKTNIPRFLRREVKLGDSIFELLTAQRRLLFEEIFQQVLLGERRREELKMKHIDGREFWLELHFTPVIDSDNKITGVFFNALDITGIRQAQDNIRKALVHQKELNRLKSRFVSTVSHEFRTPLAGISSNAQLLKKHALRLDEDKRESIFRRIFDSINYLRIMLEEVSLLGKDQTEMLKYNPQEVALGDFCQQVVEEIESTYQTQCPINLTIDDPERIIKADGKLLRHILLNLLGNAVKYSPDAKPVGFTVDSKYDKKLNIKIEDQGIGIASDDLRYIFESFYRGQNVEDIEGTGLGMAIVKRCVELHHGDITIDSLPGSGTTVHLSIPFDS